MGQSAIPLIPEDKAIRLYFPDTITLSHSLALHFIDQQNILRYSAIVKYNTMATWCLVCDVFTESWGPDKHHQISTITRSSFGFVKWERRPVSWRDHVVCLKKLATAKTWTCLSFTISVALKLSRHSSKVIHLHNKSWLIMGRIKASESMLDRIRLYPDFHLAQTSKRSHFLVYPQFISIQ